MTDLFIDSDTVKLFFTLVFLAMIYLFGYNEPEINKYDTVDEYFEHIRKEHPDIFNEWLKYEDDEEGTK